MCTSTTLRQASHAAIFGVALALTLPAGTASAQEHDIAYGTHSRTIRSDRKGCRYVCRTGRRLHRRACRGAGVSLLTAWRSARPLRRLAQRRGGHSVDALSSAVGHRSKLQHFDGGLCFRQLRSPIGCPERTGSRPSMECRAGRKWRPDCLGELLFWCPHPDNDNGGSPHARGPGWIEDPRRR